MAYSIAVGETRPLLDETLAPLASTGVTDPSGNPPPFAVGLQATISDSGGFLICVGNSAGTISFSLKRDGIIATHEVTVTGVGPSFDWSLGDPI